MASLTITALVTATAPADAQRRQTGWERLGCVEVGRRPDFDVIRVGRKEGAYRALRLEVEGNSVHIDRFRVIYGNGRPDELELRSDYREGAETRAIDLAGRDRSLDRIEIVSRTSRALPGRGPARICVAGLTVDAGPGGRNQGGGKAWERLGCQRVGLFRDRDVIRIGRREGAFRAIRLEVSGNDVFFNRVVVTYGNGRSDRLDVDRLIRENETSGPLDLKGSDRKLDQIELIYRSRPNFNGSATVCVSGLD